ncbi:glycoside hydrolase family 1 protein [Candidatus Gottesmanbacteria bacterium]|nr:glycoside hydrolase family 1 protein [Candidatus Gottesmanbacteria bacterium]
MKYQFPKHFFWGTSTAAQHVEGKRTPNDWSRWEAFVRRFSGRACEHYARYKKDFGLAKKMNTNAHRFSIEWSRIEPSEGKFQVSAIRHYRNVLLSLRRLNIIPFVTLHHFTNPLWFSEKGGFEKHENIAYFERYVERCVKEFGDLTEYWITINEPTVYLLKVLCGIGIWPQKRRGLRSAVRIFTNLSKAHNRAYLRIHAVERTAHVGAAHQVISYYPWPYTVTNRLLTRVLHFVVNTLFWRWTRGHHDFIGINHYFHNPVSLARVMRQPKTNQQLLEMISGNGKSFGWNMKPEGMYRVVMDAAKRFRKPIIITEHGISDPGDRNRQKYLVRTLEYIHRAIAEGADVRGYFHFSLMDNYEWHLGFTPKFGLYKVNFRTQERTPRKSAFVFAAICKQNGFSDSILDSGA